MVRYYIFLGGGFYLQHLFEVYYLNSTKEQLTHHINNIEVLQ